MRRRADLALLCALAAAAVAVVIATPDTRIARAILGVPLVCGATGYAFLAASSPVRDGGAWLTMLVPAASFAIAMLAALLLFALGIPLTADAFVIVLGAWTVGAAGVAAIRRDADVSPPLALPPLFSSGWAVSLTAAAAVFAVSVALLQHPIRDDQVAGYAALSALPSRDGADVRVTVTNAQPARESYRLEVDVGARRPIRQTLTLAAGQEWSRLLVRSASGQRPQLVKVRLYRTSTPDAIYRQVILRA
jgi:hypothetical protein